MSAAIGKAAVEVTEDAGKGIADHAAAFGKALMSDVSDKDKLAGHMVGVGMGAGSSVVVGEAISPKGGGGTET